MDLVRISSLLAVASLARADVKAWAPNTNYGNPSNWDAARAPCRADRAVFPAYSRFSVLLPEGSTAVRELVLPLSGELMLPLDGGLVVTGEASPGRDCHDPRDVVFSGARTEYWLQPSSWRSSDDNPAVPHGYRVPCQYDAVVFPPRSSFSVALPAETVHVKQISMQGQDVSAEDWRSFLMTDTGERQFLAPEESRQSAVAVRWAESCDDAARCSCLPEAAQAEVCRLQEPLCGPPPICFSPVRPLGHCCDVCGAYLLLGINRKFRLSHLKLSVETLLRKEEYSGLAYHAGKAAETDQVQVVLVDRGDYSTAPRDAIRELARLVLNRKQVPGVSSVVQYSAGPHNYPDGAGRIIGGVFGPMFGVIAMLGFFYFVYVIMDNKPFLSLSTSGGGSFVFARFDNAPDETADQETAMEATEAARMHLEVGQSEPANAFDNPMFGKAAASVSAVAPPQSRPATQENPMFIELQRKHSSASEDTVEEDLLSNQDEDERSPSAPEQ